MSTDKRSSANYRFFTCDVFTRHRFGGNQLAVLPDATGLSSRQMQQIAREFNYSETTFVFPAEQGHTHKVRIFTPTREVPFAGHPNIGTAFVLSSMEAFGPIEGELKVTFEEEAGLVPVSISAKEKGRLWCELLAPQSLTRGKMVDPKLAASALSLEPCVIATHIHPPQVAGVGLPFLIVELKSLESLGKAVFNLRVLEELQQMEISPDILLYTKDSDDVDIRARMFAPLDGVPEDPATGSANCALAALLSHHDPAVTGDNSWRIAQGVEMGRPSILEARTQKRDGIVTASMIGGDCVMVSEGVIAVNESQD